MSSMIPHLLASISIGGPGGSGGPSGGPEGPGDQDSPDVVSLLRKAMDALQQAAQVEKDDIDASKITKIAAQVHAQIAAEQQLTDQAMGAGPGVKMIRKTAPSGGGAGGGY